MKNTPLALLFSLLSIPFFAQVSITEKQALLDLYAATQGDNWNNSWNIKESISQWQGVTVKNDKVVSISLLFNNMEGNIPASIGQLKNLETLELSFNKLTGSLPVELGELTNLKVLAFNGNNLTGTIPMSIGQLKNLKQLHLSSNKLTGNIPEEVADLGTLEVLNIFDNNLSGDIPLRIAYSKNLKQIIVAENDFATSNEFFAALLSSKATIDFKEPFVIPTNKDVIAIESEEEN